MITETKFYVPIVTLSNQDNVELLQQLKSGFKRTINWKKYQSSIKTYAKNRYLNHLVDPSFQGVKRVFVLSFQNEDDRTSQSTYYLPKVEIKDYNVIIDGKKFFEQPINNNIKTYENIRKIATGKEDDCATGCLLHYSYFKDHYKMIAKDFSKPQVLDADARATQQINFTANLDRAGNTIHYRRSKRNCFGLFTRSRKSFVNAKRNLTFHQYKMTQYNSLNEKLSNSQLYKLKVATKMK